MHPSVATGGQEPPPPEHETQFVIDPLAALEQARTSDPMRPLGVSEGF